MAPITPVGPPSLLVAGDAIVFTSTYAEYPQSEGWVLSWSWRGIDLLDSASGEVVGDGGIGWTTTIAASRTHDLREGTYRAFGLMTGSGAYASRRHVVFDGVLNIKPDPTGAAAGEMQAQCEKDLTVIRAVLAGRLADDMQMYMIGGRQVLLIPFAELRAMRADLERQLWRLQNPGSAFVTSKVRFPGAVHSGWPWPS